MTFADFIRRTSSRQSVFLGMLPDLAAAQANRHS
jgi:hypothetical protein